jgi:hypothetical protein
MRGRARSFPSNGICRFRRRRLSFHDLGTITLVFDDTILPNGLAFSPDQRATYIDDFWRGHIAPSICSQTARSPNTPIACLRSAAVLSPAQAMA